MLNHTSSSLPKKYVSELSVEVAKTSQNAREIGIGGYEDNEKIWAGYTYLAQLVVHDLTHLRSSGSKGLENREDAKLNLSTIFGDGPGMGDFYAKGGDRFAWSEEPTKQGKWIQPRAIPKYEKKNSKKTFTLADPRNDDNVIILQLRNLFCLLYEREQRKLRDKERARQAVERYFRSVIRFDLCDKLLMEKFANMVRNRPDELLSYAGQILTSASGEIYREFNYAVGRIGHSMTRTTYLISDAQVGTKHISVADLVLAGKANAFSKREALWRANWSRLFHREGVNRTVLRSRRISPLLDPIFKGLSTDAQHDSKGNGIFSNKLMVIDLFRSHDLLQSGQEIARKLKEIAKIDIDILENDRLFIDALVDKKKIQEATVRFNNWFAGQPDWATDTPLLLYVLIEAHNMRKGKCLGPVGSFVFAAAIAQGLGKLDYDPKIRTMPDLLNFFYQTGPFAKPLIS